MLMLKFFIRKKLEGYVKRYFKAHSEIKLVVVTGSVGKTSTKVAIATLLSRKFKVRVHQGNHNTHLSAPLAILGIKYPDNIKNIISWFSVFRQAKQKILEPTDVDVIVQELGADRIGEIPHFGKYLQPDIAVVTAVSPEHMEFFKTIDNVAREELEAANFSKEALVNYEDIDIKYMSYIKNPKVESYGTGDNSNYRLKYSNFNFKDGYETEFFAPQNSKGSISSKICIIGDYMLRPVVAALAVARKFGMSDEEILASLAKLKPTPGRMNMIKGLNGSLLIDDTYNSSPLAVSSAIQTLYNLDSPQRIAVLGSMNELGDTSEAEHREIGKMCDPSKLSYLVTVGDEANRYIAEEANSKDCKVKTCMNALEAGAFVVDLVKNTAGSVVLLKGSQGGIFLEEATKMLLESSKDDYRLVRQNSDWMKIKNKFFNQK